MLPAKTRLRKFASLKVLLTLVERHGQEDGLSLEGSSDGLSGTSRSFAKTNNLSRILDADRAATYAKSAFNATPTGDYSTSPHVWFDERGEK